MRSRPGVPLHRHVPVQQPGGRERDAARRPFRQRGTRGAPCWVRADHLRVRRPGSRPETGRRDRETPVCRTIRASRRGSRWGSTCPTSRTLGERGSDELGYGPFSDGGHALATEPDRPAEHGVSAFMTDRVIEWLGHQDGPGSPMPATGGRTRPMRQRVTGRSAYDPDDVALPVRPPEREVPFCGRLMDPAPAGREGDARAPGAVLRDGLGRRPRARQALRRAGSRVACGTTRSWSSPPTTASSWATRGCSARAACSSRATTSSGSCATRGRREPARNGRGPVHGECGPLPDDLRSDGSRRPGAVRRAAAHFVPPGRPTHVVARRGALGIRLALGVHPVRSTSVAVGPAARDQAPDGVALRSITRTCSSTTGTGAASTWARSDLAHRGLRQRRGARTCPGACSPGVPDSPTGHSPTCSQ